MSFAWRGSSGGGGGVSCGWNTLQSCRPAAVCAERDGTMEEKSTAAEVAPRFQPNNYRDGGGVGPRGAGQHTSSLTPPTPPPAAAGLLNILNWSPL